MMGRALLKQLTGKEPVEISVPFGQMQVGYLFHPDNTWQEALACYSGCKDSHYPIAVKIINTR